MKFSSMLKQDRQTDRLRAHLLNQVTPPSPIAPSPVWSGSACAGFPDNFNIATPSTGKKPDPRSSRGQLSQHSIPLKPPMQPSSPRSSASSTTTIGGGGGGSPGASGFNMGSGSSPLHRPAGVGSELVAMSEKEIYWSTDLSHLSRLNNCL